MCAAVIGMLSPWAVNAQVDANADFAKWLVELRQEAADNGISELSATDRSLKESKPTTTTSPQE